MHVHVEQRSLVAVKLACACLAGNSSRSDRLAVAPIYGGGMATSVNQCPVAVATGGFVLAGSNASAD